MIISHSAEFTESITSEVWAVLDGKMTPSGHNWVQGQGAGPRLTDKADDEEEKFDAMGNKIEGGKKKKKVSDTISISIMVGVLTLSQLTSSELRKKKKDRMARRKRGEEVFTDEDEE